MMIYEGGIGSGWHGEPNIHGMVNNKVFQAALSCDTWRAMWWDGTCTHLWELNTGRE